MQRSLALARRGRGAVEPNPMVGCVLVRDGRILAEGWHRRFGGLHAEVEALRGVHDARGATAYVTLEPCCHHGKTPPCTDALISAGVARVVAPFDDPNPLVAGKGFGALQRAGIAVTRGVLSAACAALNAPYFKLSQTGRPWVIAKWAQSIDGRLATRTGDAKWISNDAMRVHVHQTRGRVDAIIAGVGTVLADDPMLTCRSGRARRVATRIVLDSRLRTPASSQLVRTAAKIPTWFVCAKSAPVRRALTLEKAGCRLLVVRHARDGLDLEAVTLALGRARMTNVIVEGGGTVLGGFFDRRLVDEAHIYIAPLLIGGTGAVSAISGRGPARLADAIRFEGSPQTRKFGCGWLFTARVRAPG